MMIAREPDDPPEVLVSLRTLCNANQLAREHQNRQLRHWRPIFHIDDSSFTVSTNDRPARVWRRQEERYTDCIIVDVDR